MHIYNFFGVVVNPSVPLWKAHLLFSCAVGISMYSLITHFSVIANTCQPKNEEKIWERLFKKGLNFVGSTRYFLCCTSSFSISHMFLVKAIYTFFFPSFSLSFFKQVIPREDLQEAWAGNVLSTSMVTDRFTAFVTCSIITTCIWSRIWYRKCFYFKFSKTNNLLNSSSYF